MSTLQKHRLERDWYAVDFSAELGAEETLVRVDALEVYSRFGSEWTDRTKEFFEPDSEPVIEGAQVRFWLKSAAEGEQRAGRGYAIFLRVTTSTGRELVAADERMALRGGKLPTLVVIDGAKPAD